jgi:hypothetical protein
MVRIRIFSLTLLTAAFAAVATTPSLAQGTETVPKIKNRDAAIKTCMTLVREKVPADTQGSPARVSAYRACMAKAGHRP